jgi:hypothetical protein
MSVYYSNGGQTATFTGTSNDGVFDIVRTGGTYYWQPRAAPAPTAAAVPIPTVTGIPASELNNILYGKDIPVFVGGIALIGGRICEGPYYATVGGVQVVSFIVSLAIAANPSGTRTITSVSLNGTVSWTLAGGSLIAGMTVNTKSGTETQTPFASSVARDGSDAIAYRPHILVEILNCPLAPFGNVVPFVSGKVQDSTFGPAADGITRNDALTVLANYAGYTNSEIDISVSGLDTFWIVAANSTFIQLLQQFQALFRRWNIVTTDKLYIFESDDFTVDATLTRSNTISKSIAFTIDDPLALARELVFGFIDVDRDNEPNTAAARLDITPITTTQSVTSTSIDLPIGTTAAQAMADAYTALYFDDVARRKMACTGMLDLLGIEAGDATSFTDDDDIVFRGRVVEIARSIQNWTVDLTTEAALECIFVAPAPTTDPHFSGVVLLLGFEDYEGSTYVFDESPSSHGAAVVFGNAHITTAQQKFGLSSATFDGAFDSAGYVDSGDWNFGSGLFTVECSIRAATVAAGTRFIIGQWYNAGGLGWVLYQDGSQAKWNVSTDGTNNFNDLAGGALTTGAWFDVAVDYDGSKYRLYVDGVMVASSATARTINNSGNSLNIGSNSGQNAFFFNGWIDEMRVTKGVARYASDSGYTIATSAFPRS